MSITSCPFPDNINPLSPTGFMLQVEKLPEVQFFCQEASIPSVALPAALQGAGLIYIPQKGDQLDYSDLTVTFLVDSQLKNYKAINRWMTNGLPSTGQTETMHSDGSLHILGPNNAVIQTVQFADLIPISLESLTFSSTQSDVNYLTGSVTFRYSYYHFL